MLLFIIAQIGGFVKKTSKLEVFPLRSGETAREYTAPQDKNCSFRKIRSLGLSNWYIEEIDDFIAQVNIKPAHILENISLFDFELTEDEMKQIAALDRNEKHDWY